MKKKPLIIAIAGVLALSGGAAGLYFSGYADKLLEIAQPKPAEPAAPPPKPEITVKIGHAAPTNGPQAAIGKENESGVVLAIEELNAQALEIGGAKIKFELVSEDDEANPEMSVQAAQKLVAAKVNGVVGHVHSGATTSAAKVYSEAGIPQVSGWATNPKYTEQGYKTAYRIISSDSQQAHVLGDYAISQSVKKVAVINDGTDYGKGLADEFKKTIEAEGIKVVFDETTDDKTRNFSAQMKKLKTAKADLLFFGGMDIQAGFLMKHIKVNGLKMTFLTGEGACTKEAMVIAGKSAEGFCAVSGQTTDNLAAGQDFKGKFSKRFGYEPTKYAQYSYDATKLLVDAMKRANSVAPATYLAEVGKTAYDGVTGKIAFDPAGNLKGAPVSIFKYDSGKLTLSETLNDKSSFALAEPAPAQAADTPAQAADTPAQAADAPAQGEAPAKIESENVQVPPVKGVSAQPAEFKPVAGAQEGKAAEFKPAAAPDSKPVEFKPSKP